GRADPRREHPRRTVEEETTAMTARVRRRTLLAAAGALPLAARAQPIAGGRPIRIIVPFGAGGAVDIVARIVAQELTPRLGQSVVVENRTGAGGNIAMEHVARAQPDGTTLLMASPSVTINPHLYAAMPIDPATQLAPVALVGEVPSVMLAAPGFEAADARAFVALARARPGAYTFGSGGAGTTEHLAAELLKARTGIEITHVPYRGGAPAMADLQAGRISIMFSNLAGATGHLQAGRLKALGLADTRRAPALPDLPTLEEQGIPGMVVTVWWGVMAPAGMPPDITARLNAALNEALASPEMRAALERLSAQPLGGTAESFGARLARETESWGGVIRAAGIRAE
ncbi:MAG TPA: tripartite tricarboxylate transporter substrate binding protein, partial [Acetobacteraceae bacterium]|nr:tripartite tricarboxylate transporter substrate binding protein [Acetobacteraceae bacterium]